MNLLFPFLMGFWVISSQTFAEPPDRNVQVSLISTGQDRTCALTASQKVYCWGSNADGQLSLGQADQETHTVPVRIDSTPIFAAISAGFRHTCGLTAAGKAYCWGWNQFGQLGNGSRQSAKLAKVAGGIKFKQLSAFFACYRATGNPSIIR